jgi:hypothetical protein
VVLAERAADGTVSTVHPTSASYVCTFL